MKKGVQVQHNRGIFFGKYITEELGAKYEEKK